MGATIRRTIKKAKKCSGKSNPEPNSTPCTKSSSNFSSKNGKLVPSKRTNSVTSLHQRLKIKHPYFTSENPDVDQKELDLAIKVARGVAYNIGRKTTPEIDRDQLCLIAEQIVWEKHLTYNKKLATAPFSIYARTYVWQGVYEEIRRTSYINRYTLQRIEEGRKTSPIAFFYPVQIKEDVSHDDEVFGSLANGEYMTSDNIPKSKYYESDKYIFDSVSLDQVLSKLPEKLRDIIVWKYIDGFTLEEIADHLEMSRPWVSAKVLQAMTMAKKVANDLLLQPTI